MTKEAFLKQAEELFDLGSEEGVSERELFLLLSNELRNIRLNLPSEEAVEVIRQAFDQMVFNEETAGHSQLDEIEIEAGIGRYEVQTTFDSRGDMPRFKISIYEPPVNHKSFFVEMVMWDSYYEPKADYDTNPDEYVDWEPCEMKNASFEVNEVDDIWRKVHKWIQDWQKEWNNL